MVFGEAVVGASLDVGDRLEAAVGTALAGGLAAEDWEELLEGRIGLSKKQKTALRRRDGGC